MIFEYFLLVMESPYNSACHRVIITVQWASCSGRHGSKIEVHYQQSFLLACVTTLMSTKSKLFIKTGHAVVYFIC